MRLSNGRGLASRVTVESIYMLLLRARMLRQGNYRS